MNESPPIHLYPEATLLHDIKPAVYSITPGKILTGDSYSMQDVQPIVVDGKYQLVRGIDVPTDTHDVTLEYSVQIKKEFAAPFTIIMRLGWDDTWVPSVHNSAFIMSDCEDRGDWWFFTETITRQFRLRSPRRLHFMVRADSEVNLDSSIAIVKQQLDEVKSDA